MILTEALAGLVRNFFENDYKIFEFADSDAATRFILWSESDSFWCCGPGSTGLGSIRKSHSRAPTGADGRAIERRAE